MGRRKWRLGLVFLLLGMVFAPVHAEDADDSAVYQIMDVAVDVTASDAAHARDQAIMQAQRSAFDQLLGRLGVDKAQTAKLDDEGLAAMVRAFEVQQERVSSVRYIGSFTVQFKPDVVRRFLDKGGARYSEVRSQPVVVLPIVSANGRNILWEDTTLWRSAWESAMRRSGLVPLVVPAGDLDDIAQISTVEALSGRAESLQSLMRKYQAGGLLVAVLNADPAHPDPKQEPKVDLRRYDISGRAEPPSQRTLVAAPDAKTMAAALAEGIKHIRADMESGWREANKAPVGPVMHLPVMVPIATIAEWTGIKNRLASVPAVSRASVIALTRGLAEVELEFRGDIPGLQSALASQSLELNASQGSGGWVLHMKETETP